MALGLVCVPAADARAKPDLVVKAFKFRSSPPRESAKPPYVALSSDGHGKFGVKYKIENVGKARAPKSSVIMVANGFFLVNERIGSIPPGGFKLIRKSYDEFFTDGPGLYQARVCADFGNKIKESDENNNCIPDFGFAVVALRWTVDFFATDKNTTATAPQPTFHTRAAPGMTFDFYGVVAENGAKHYLWLANGTVNASVDGSSSGCETYSGSGTVSHSPWDVVEPDVGELEMTTDLDHYLGFVQDTSDKGTYQGTETCGGFTFPAEFQMDALQTLDNNGTVSQPMKDVDKILKGNYDASPPGGHVVGDWSFTAQVP